MIVLILSLLFVAVLFVLITKLLFKQPTNLFEALSLLDKKSIGRILADDGTDINARSTKGLTPLMIAIDMYPTPLHRYRFNQDFIDMIELLMQYGADSAWKNKDGDSALTVAQHMSKAGRGQIVTFLQNVTKLPRP